MRNWCCADGCQWFAEPGTKGGPDAGGATRVLWRRSIALRVGWALASDAVVPFGCVA